MYVLTNGVVIGYSRLYIYTVRTVNQVNYYISISAYARKDIYEQIECDYGTLWLYKDDYKYAADTHIY